MNPGPHTPRAVERARILASFETFSVPDWARRDILEALDSPEWNWFEDTDGCTCVSEVYWPNKFFPPCLRHDFDWFTGRPVWPANFRFYRLQRVYRMTVLRSAVRFAGVTVGWYAFFKWRNMIRNRRKTPCAPPPFA